MISRLGVDKRNQDLSILWVNDHRWDTRFTQLISRPSNNFPMTQGHWFLIPNQLTGCCTALIVSDCLWFSRLGSFLSYSKAKVIYPIFFKKSTIFTDSTNHQHTRGLWHRFTNYITVNVCVSWNVTIVLLIASYGLGRHPYLAGGRPSPDGEFRRSEAGVAVWTTLEVFMNYNWLVVTGIWNMFFLHILGRIIPIDELILFGGIETTNQILSNTAGPVFQSSLGDIKSRS